MAMLKLGLDQSAAEVDAVVGLGYTGPTPPAGVYPCVIKQVKLTQTKDKTKMMVYAIMEIKAPKGHSAEEFNGFPFHHRLTIPDSKDDEHYGLKVGQINRLLDAVSGDDSLRRLFWGDQAVFDEKTQKILKVGKFRFYDANGKTTNIPVHVSGRPETYTRSIESNGKPVIDPETKKQKVERITTLRVNDVYPDKKPAEKVSADEVGAVEDLDDDTIVEEAAVEDDPVEETLVEVDEPADPEPEEEQVEPEPEPELEEPEPVAGEAEELPEEPVEEAPPARKRRSAF